MKRRDFIKYVGLATGSTAGVGWFLKSTQEPEGRDLAQPAPGVERWVPSVCQLCAGGCGIRVRLVDDVPVRIEGNPLFPANRGGLCPTGQAGLQILFSPDRIKSPLRRVGARGARRWEKISWEEAIQTIVGKLRSLRSANAAQKVAFLDGGSRGLLRDIIRQFLSAYGSPNYIDTGSRANAELPFFLTQGRWETPQFDLANTNYILSFGFDLLEAEAAPVWQSQVYARLREGSKRGRLVAVDPRFSITAAKADKWIPVSPGTEGALALGIAYVLIQEELYDSSFVHQYTHGFEDWKDREGRLHKGLKSLVLKNYYPEAVSTITGVPIEDIFRIARGFAEHQPGIAICGERAYSHTNGLNTRLAVHALNALLGNLQRAGGVLQVSRPPLAHFARLKPDRIAKASLGQIRIDEAGTRRFPLARHVPEAIPQNILNARPYDIQLLFLYGTNPLFESPGGLQWKDALEKVPLVVAAGSFLNETAEMADLLLPEPVYLERWGEEYEIPNVRFPHFGLRRPVVEPSYDVRHTGDVILSLAKEFGPPLSNALPFDDYLSLLKHAAQGIFSSGQGAIISGTFEEAMMQYLKERGWRYPGPATFNEFWKSLTENGGWVDVEAAPSRPAFGTPSGKFEFSVTRLEEAIQSFSEGEPGKKKTAAAHPEVRESLARYEEPRFVGNEAVYPYHLILFHINTLLNESAANTPAMMEMVGFRNGKRWDSWVEINPETAARIGIREGDPVWVESVSGKVKTTAKVFAGAMPDTAAIPIGMGRLLGRFAQGRGVNPMVLVPPQVDPLFGASPLLSTRVKVYRA